MKPHTRHFTHPTRRSCAGQVADAPASFSVARAAAGAFWGTLGGSLLGLALGLAATAVADLSPVVRLGFAPLASTTPAIATALGAALGGVVGGWQTPAPAPVTNHTPGT